MDLVERFFVDAPERASGRARVVTGEIPAGLRGTALRNGAATFRLGSDRLGFFDAHGLVAGLTFADRAAWWRAARVRSPVAVEEHAAGRMVRRRVFANRPGGWSRNAFRIDVAPGNAGNHDAFAWRGKVVAAADGGMFALDGNLETIGPFNLDPGAEGVLCSPMPFVDPATGHLVGYTVRPGVVTPDQLAFVEVATDGTVKRTAPVPLGGSPVIVHGHACSARWYAVVELGARLQKAKAILGTETIFRSFRWPEPCTLVLVPRTGGGAPVRIPLPDVKVVFHLFDAWDDGDRLEIIAATYTDIPALDAIVPPDAAIPADPAVPRLVRWSVDPTSASLSATELGSLASDAGNLDPRFRGRPHRLLFGPVPGGPVAPLDGFYGYFHGLAAIDLQTGDARTWTAGPDRWVSPPAFAPRGPDEGDGWLVAFTLGEGGTGAVILDATRVEEGPVAELALDAELPGVSHARFWPDLVLARAE